MNGIFAIWDQYLLENMKWFFGNMGLVSSNKSIDGQCWKFGKGWVSTNIENEFARVKTNGFNDRKTHGKPTWWNLNKIFEMLKHVG